MTSEDNSAELLEQPKACTPKAEFCKDGQDLKKALLRSELSGDSKSQPPHPLSAT